LADREVESLKIAIKQSREEPGRSVQPGSMIEDFLFTGRMGDYFPQEHWWKISVYSLVLRFCQFSHKG